MSAQLALLAPLARAAVSPAGATWARRSIPSAGALAWTGWRWIDRALSSPGPPPVPSWLPPGAGDGPDLFDGGRSDRPVGLPLAALRGGGLR